MAAKSAASKDVRLVAWKDTLSGERWVASWVMSLAVYSVDAKDELKVALMEARWVDEMVAMTDGYWAVVLVGVMVEHLVDKKETRSAEHLVVD